MSRSVTTTPRWLLVSVLIFVALAACFATTATLLWLRDYQAGTYPGARQLSGQTGFTWLPTPHYRLNGSYRSSDAFPDIVNWYQTQLGVGAEAQAQGGCSHLFGRQHRFLLNQSASVTVCETSRGRLIFVQRVTTVSLR